MEPTLKAGAAVADWYNGGSGGRWTFGIEDATPFWLDPRPWKGLASPLGAPSEHYAWSASAVEAFGHRVRAITAYDAAGRRAALLLLNSSQLLRHAHQPGAAELREPADLLYRDGAALGALVRGLAEHRVSFCCSRLPADSPTVTALQEAYRGRGLVRITEQGSCPYLPLAESADDPLAGLNSRLRSDLRRARKRAEAWGGLRYRQYSPTPAEVKPLLRQALEIEDASWKGGGGTALLRDPLRRSFFERYCERAASAGDLRIELLHIGEEPAAMQLAAEFHNRYWLFKIGYDPRFRSCSPGMLLLLESLRRASAEKLESYEFLGSSSDWTRRWTRRERPMVKVRVYAFHPKGAGLLVRDGARWLRSRIVGAQA